MTKSAGSAAQLVMPRGKDAVLARFADMAAVIPKADDSEAAYDIVGRILAADSLNGIDAPWSDDDSEVVPGQQIVIHGATLRESDHKDGLGVYLRIDYTDIRTGAQGSFSCGAMSVIAQLVKAYTLDALPFAALIVEEATRSGNTAMHLEILDDQSAARPVTA